MSKLIEVCYNRCRKNKKAMMYLLHQDKDKKDLKSQVARRFNQYIKKCDVSTETQMQPSVLKGWVGLRL